MHPVTEQEVVKIVSGCKCETSYGHDEINLKTFKQYNKDNCETPVFKRKLIYGYYPNDMKLPKFIPIGAHF